LDVDPFGHRPHHLAEELKTLAWPEPPRSLLFFASALKTCRTFNNILSNEVQIENSSPGRVLQRLQYHGMNELAQTLHLRSGWHRSLLDESCYIHFIYRKVGSFWKNPMIFDQENCFGIGEFLMGIPQLSRLILIPHLQPWLLYETGQEEEEDILISDREDEGEGEDEDESPLVPENCHSCEIVTTDSKSTGRILTLGVGGNLDHCHYMCLEEGQFEKDDNELDIVSIAGVPSNPAKGVPDERDLDEHELDDDELVQQTLHRSCDPELPVLCDIRDSEPDTWWLFPPEDYYHTRVDGDEEDSGLAEYENHWFLVNYKLRKLYMGPNGTEAYYWDNVWDIPARKPRPKPRTSQSRRNLTDKEVQTESHSSYGESQLRVMVRCPWNNSNL